MRSINTLFGALIISAPLMVASNASAGNDGGPSEGGDTTSVVKLVLALLADIDLSVGGWGSGVDLSACGTADVDLLAKVKNSCEVKANVDASLWCDPVHVGLEASLECAAQCDLDASLACTASCDVDLAAQCALDLNFNAAAECMVQCDIDADASCKAKAAKGECDYASCKVAADASCKASCAAALDVSAFAACELKVGAACDAKCDASANLDCQVDCQANVAAELEAECEADLNVDGALYCDDAWVKGVVDAELCLKAVLSL